MSDLATAATAIISQAERRLEIVGDNIANATTPAYKRRVAFSKLVSPTNGTDYAGPQIVTAVDSQLGKLVQTGNPCDLAITGTGQFAVQTDDVIRFTRSGRFTRREDGRLVDALGEVLLAANGSEVVVDSEFSVRTDGTIISKGGDASRIGLFLDSTAATAPNSKADATTGLLPPEEVHISQGAYESSNVSTGEEMVTMMQALRLAESGQRVMITYDDLMGRVISTFGESVK